MDARFDFDCFFFKGNGMIIDGMRRMDGRFDGVGISK